MPELKFKKQPALQTKGYKFFKNCIFAEEKNMNQTETYTKEDVDIDVLVDNDHGCQLIVWNDEVNSFDWVITTLVEVCGHSTEQAEQCAMIIHTKGKYSVKEGSYDVLKPMCDSITERGIGATVEELSEH